MQYICKYPSPIGEMTIISDGKALTELKFITEKFVPNAEHQLSKAVDLPIFEQTTTWLDRYFKGENPGKLPKLNLSGTPFQTAVWDVLIQIPYGQTITYKYIAEQIAKQRGKAKMSSQAVGGAVGHNPVSIIVPCHRVIGTNGCLTGYAGGLDKKVSLLKYEHVNMEKMFLPKAR